MGIGWKVGFIAGFCLAMFGCAAAEFNFKHYGLQAKSYEGKLLGPTENEDIDLSVCAPDDKEQGKCYVYLREEHRRLKEDYLNTKQELMDLQRRCGASDGR